MNIYYEVHGSGEPLLLDRGPGVFEMWYKQVPILSKSHKVIIFDNRGAGNTDKPDSEYTVELMAEDAAGLLSELRNKVGPRTRCIARGLYRPGACHNEARNGGT
ncbi:MAG: alpha/beta hydrolase [Thermodesulfobacteriota bacterium]